VGCVGGGCGGDRCDFWTKSQNVEGGPWHFTFTIFPKIAYILNSQINTVPTVYPVEIVQLVDKVEGVVRVRL
jgi:hypothetical protein